MAHGLQQASSLLISPLLLLLALPLMLPPLFILLARERSLCPAGLPAKPASQEDEETRVTVSLYEERRGQHQSTCPTYRHYDV